MKKIRNLSTSDRDRGSRPKMSVAAQNMHTIRTVTGALMTPLQQADLELLDRVGICANDDHGGDEVQ